VMADMLTIVLCVALPDNAKVRASRMRTSIPAHGDRGAALAGPLCRPCVSAIPPGARQGNRPRESDHHLCDPACRQVEAANAGRSLRFFEMTLRLLVSGPAISYAGWFKHASVCSAFTNKTANRAPLGKPRLDDRMHHA
jgi:hypothetical protein